MHLLEETMQKEFNPRIFAHADAVAPVDVSGQICLFLFLQTEDRFDSVGIVIPSQEQISPSVNLVQVRDQARMKKELCDLAQEAGVPQKSERSPKLFVGSDATSVRAFLEPGLRFRPISVKFDIAGRPYGEDLDD